MNHEAEAFLNDETEFHLGFLPTEQSHPDTRTMEADFLRNTADGVRTLQRPDRAVLAMAESVLNSALFRRMTAEGVRCVRQGGRIVFSGCGATGRLSILLESMWRTYGKWNDSAGSIMTGGDFALIRSVESFEDYQVFGRRQVADLKMNEKDMLVAITEGGETSSVIGSVKEAADRGCAVFLLFNNPAALLREKLVRCREVIDDPRVTVVDLSCGPMALAGSTRMQATSSEQLIGGAFLEAVAAELEGRETPDFAAGFREVLDHLESAETVAQLAAYIDFEAEIYRGCGKLTYLANDYLLDIFTDTTERSPTFMLPPFRSKTDSAAPLSWAFVKNPLFDTAGTWNHMLRRPLRCIEWTRSDYLAMNAGEKILANPPKISAGFLLGYEVGNETAPERFAPPGSGAVIIEVAGAPGNAALEKAAQSYPVLKKLVISSGSFDSPLHLLNHMALKLALNTVSTGTMVKLGRVSGNWMSHVSISNKKLIDRGIRLIAELGNLSYSEACSALFDSVEAMKHEHFAGNEPPSAVQYTLTRLR